MISLTLSEIAEAVEGTLFLENTEATPESKIDGLSQTDSREVREGHIFFARRGEETDGHLFVDSAVKNGAALIVCEKELSAGVPQIIVADTTEALRHLATHVVAKINARGHLKTVAVTGSNGKTTTKNLVGAMLQRKGDTVASEKSFNNEVGGPLTALRVQEDTDFLVAEMGASAEGEIKRLVEMAPPSIGVVLSVGLAHAGEFGGIEATFRTKSEMVTDLETSAVAVLNREDPRVRQMEALTKARVRWFGLTDESDVWADAVNVQATGTSFTLHTPEGSRDVAFKVLGEHHVMNALAATAVALELGVDLDTIVDVLERTTRPAKWRMEAFNLPQDITLINDAYNASPDSMRAALKTLAQIKKPEGRTVAVLGAMSELGEYSGAEHDQLGLLVVRLGIDELVVVGKEARRLHISAINEGSWSGESVFFEEQESALDYLRNTLVTGDTVLIKSSNSAGLRILGDDLKEALS